ncbi:6-hydroxymethylpterin diphosphokinase MptE-like protein [Paraglaciecola hydrolytica]|uniref:DUF115 domain-containing protein n=1 Tax=Paraglaciecola hydrolytica TaxID=1799789 RepID=A0A148KNN9_9ALTE|nr:6-hydroxymethylpterin diphosphokinase MptE-like protein [Paraglaciecola hydrolytica]KXI27901.1 hypothetical protein AX660_20550 [Paraglaciecola hydrolytica]
MLKNIKLHIEQDELLQDSLEAKLAQHITHTKHQNINAFQRHIPSLVAIIDSAQSQNISLICNKFEKFNIVDYGLGRVLYGFDPETEIRQQFDYFSHHAPFVDFTGAPKVHTTERDNNTLEALPSYQHHMAYQALPKSVDLLVVLGLGLGHHIKLLIESCQIKHLIIYEPELQYFSCSVLVTPWFEILASAKEKGTSLYFQLEKDGRDLVADISELREHNQDVAGFYLYQHYHAPVFNSLVKACKNNSWSTIYDKGLSFSLQESNDEYCPLWTPPAELTSYQDVSPEDSQFQHNLHAFKHYFPDIYQEFKDYKPKNWLPVKTAGQQINLLKMDSLASWYGSHPEEDCLLNFSNYTKQPNKDGLVLGYSGQKLRHYLHYEFVREAEVLLDEIEEEQAELPSNIKSMILFGLGVGYQLEHLIKQHQVEKLFLCEPNRDFFYASLFAIDWAGILSTIDEQKGRLYINIGDDGTNLFRDLLHQFYAIGPYILSHTYFYQSYYNSSLNKAIGQLREQLQVVISMGEYFDHARYGIAHSSQALLREYPHMVRNPQTQLDYEHKETPIFFVGNGPSLDAGALEHIKEWQDKAIIVSCGTSLQVLKKNGITPDFHAEIEQNRSTFDWAARIGDFEYLKSVSLISCNGIHPDTCDLYKEVFVAFKEGESSTVSTLRVIGEKHYESLRFAFPTVTNFALNFFLKLGFKQIYLLGVDLGFINNKNHHSTQSGYYNEQGEPLYDYAARNNTSLVVPGNFRPTVFTKHEFKIAKIVMEQSLKEAKVECYNTSNGARIIGSNPLQLDQILLLTSASQKVECLSVMKSNCFRVLKQEKFVERYALTYSADALHEEFAAFKSLISQPIESLKEAEELVENQKQLLFKSYQQGQSLLFYFLYGTLNFANAALNKVAYSLRDEHFAPDRFNRLREVWLEYFAKITQQVELHGEQFDTTSSFVTQRMLKCLKNVKTAKRILVLSDSAIVPNIYHSANKTWTTDFAFEFATSSQFVADRPFIAGQFDYVIAYINTDLEQQFKLVAEQVRTQLGTIPLLCICEQIIPVQLLSHKPDFVCFMSAQSQFMQPDSAYQNNDVTRAVLALLFIHDFSNFDLIVPKCIMDDNTQLPILADGGYLQDFQTFGIDIMLGLLKADKTINNEILKNGCRPVPLGKGLNKKWLCLKNESPATVKQLKLKLLDRYPYLSEGQDV